MILCNIGFWRGERNYFFTTNYSCLFHFIRKKKNQWEKKTATGATGKKLKMVVGLGVFAVDLGVGLEKVSIFLIEEVDLIY